MSDMCKAIGRQLQADYLPMLAAPLPGELRELIVRLSALEAAGRRSGDRSAGMPAVMQPGNES